MQTCYAGMLQILVTLGPEYLTRDELRDLLHKHISEYYRFLGKSLLLRRNKTIDYHRRKLNETRVGFSWPRVLRGALETLAGLAVNPQGIVERLLKPRVNSSLVEREEKHPDAPSPIPHPGDTLE
jgi:hypothetical protein